ncbi:hypothetical protein NQZ68_012632 [Dissostichus eleginoides]|nr:hypothetical protein NQZ68_012632 [Dissostichus eleginoides]
MAVGGVSGECSTDRVTNTQHSLDCKNQTPDLTSVPPCYYDLAKAIRTGTLTNIQLFHRLDHLVFSNFTEKEIKVLDVAGLPPEPHSGVLEIPKLVKKTPSYSQGASRGAC